ncbi:anaerobic sulfatase maturase [Photobacterium gaetbulicola]|uniref:anaerobic sulfatase maturase n=1 Tax=Photobacterium gaetbulicola TaxID=1295392 RepID=UPI000689D93E|nr:anaerobic sulfatase maturase [Photobacterium gaetbulicola]
MNKQPVKKTNKVKQFSAVSKPTGSKCNMNCHYCFYLHKSELLNHDKKLVMSDYILDLYIKQYIESQSGSYVEFIWQGGEPTLLGLSYFEKVVKIQRKYKKKGQAIYNSFQTNGILLNDSWCKFFKNNDFLIGISIDGPKEFYDRYRLSKSGKSVFNKVMNAIELLKKYDVEFNALCAVNDYNSRQPLVVYHFIKNIVRPKLIQFIPVVQKNDFQYRSIPINVKFDELNIDQSSFSFNDVTDWSVKPDVWGAFLKTIWKEWLANDFGNVFIDNFEDVIANTFGHGPQKCTSSQICGKGLAVEHNGDIYSCDHFVYPEYYLGNIKKAHLADIINSSQQKRFASFKFDNLTSYCKKCDYLKLCGGDCPRNRFVESYDNEYGLSYLCSGHKIFYKSVLDDYYMIINKFNEINMKKISM